MTNITAESLSTKNLSVFALFEVLKFLPSPQRRSSVRSHFSLINGPFGFDSGTVAVYWKQTKGKLFEVVGQFYFAQSGRQKRDSAVLGNQIELVVEGHRVLEEVFDN